MTTADRSTGSQWFRGIELVRVVGPFDSSPWSTDTHEFPTVLRGGDGACSSPRPT